MELETVMGADQWVTNATMNIAAGRAAGFIAW